MFSQSVAKDQEIRKARALPLVAGIRESGIPAVYHVPSSTGRGVYVVDMLMRTCNCPDFTGRRSHGDTAPCKHILAAELYCQERRRQRSVTERVNARIAANKAAF